MVRARAYGILVGYEDQNDHDTVRGDPVFKRVAGRSPAGPGLASQPTLSRFENAISVQSLKRLRDVFLDGRSEHQRVDQAPVALAVRQAPGREVDAERDLLGHLGAGVVDQRLFQGAAVKRAEVGQLADREAVPPLGDRGEDVLITPGSGQFGGRLVSHRTRLRLPAMAAVINSSCCRKRIRKVSALADSHAAISPVFPAGGAS
jgi:hypothetical protein